jgi:hypothetical protein
VTIDSGIEFYIVLLTMVVALPVAIGYATRPPHGSTIGTLLAIGVSLLLVGLMLAFHRAVYYRVAAKTIIGLALLLSAALGVGLERVEQSRSGVSTRSVFSDSLWLYDLGELDLRTSSIGGQCDVLSASVDLDSEVISADGIEVALRRSARSIREISSRRDDWELKRKGFDMTPPVVMVAPGGDPKSAIADGPSVPIQYLATLSIPDDFAGSRLRGSVDVSFLAPIRIDDRYYSESKLRRSFSFSVRVPSRHAFQAARVAPKTRPDRSVAMAIFLVIAPVGVILAGSGVRRAFVVVDERYWSTRLSEGAKIVLSQIHNMVRQIEPELDLLYYRSHISFRIGDKPFSFVRITPRGERVHIKLTMRIDSELDQAFAGAGFEWDHTIKIGRLRFDSSTGKVWIERKRDGGVESGQSNVATVRRSGTEGKWGWYALLVSWADLAKSKELLMELLQRSWEFGVEYL